MYLWNMIYWVVVVMFLCVLFRVESFDNMVLLVYVIVEYIDWENR